MRNIILFCLLCCSAALGQAVAPEKDSLRQETSPGWEAIHWQPDAASALRESRSSGKPLMIFLVVGKMGEPNARQL